MTLSLRARISIALITAAILPLAFAWLIMWATGAGGSGGPGSPIDRVALFALVLAGFAGAGLALVLTSTLLKPLKDLTAAVENAATSERPAWVVVAGEDELARLADRYNQLTSELDRRSRALDAVLAEIAAIDPTADSTATVMAAAAGARRAFDMIEAEIVLGMPNVLPDADHVPGEPIRVRATLGLGSSRFGTLIGLLRPAHVWRPADQALLELFATGAALAIRNVHLRDQVEHPNERSRAARRRKPEAGE